MPLVQYTKLRVSLPNVPVTNPYSRSLVELEIANTNKGLVPGKRLTSERNSLHRSFKEDFDLFHKRMDSLLHFHPGGSRTNRGKGFLFNDLIIETDIFAHGVCAQFFSDGTDMNDTKHIHENIGYKEFIDAGVFPDVFDLGL